MQGLVRLDLHSAIDHCGPLATVKWVIDAIVDVVGSRVLTSRQHQQDKDDDDEEEGRHDCAQPVRRIRCGECTVRLLAVEDDVMIGAALTDLLRQVGHAVDWARDGVAADAALLTTSYDLVILDLGLPLRDGLSVLRDLRGRRDTTPVLIATARDAVADRIAGLDAGADDYVTKPFDFEELQARIRSVVRRAAGHPAPVYSHGQVRLNPATREAALDGRPVLLSAREWAVLEPLLLRPGVTFSRQQLEEKLYGWEQEVSSNAVEVYVHGLRKKLGADFIRTVRGLGYRVARE